MNSKEVQELTGLTRKALEYYEENGLINPIRGENNYRNYSEVHIELLNKISLYRKLGLSIEEIKSLLHSNEAVDVGYLLREKSRRLKNDSIKLQLLENLLLGDDCKGISEKLKALENEETIYEKLTGAFPGYFGQLIFSSYKPFLGEEISDMDAYRKYVDYLDSLPPLKLDANEIKYLEMGSLELSMDDLDKATEDKLSALEDFENWYEKNKDIIAEYKDFKESKEYKSSPMFKIEEMLRSYMMENNYYEVAIPLIRLFSPAYNEYYENLLSANSKFLAKK